MEHIIDGRVLVLDDEDDHLIAAGPLTIHQKHLFVRCGRRAVHTLVMGVPPGQRVVPIDGSFLNCRRSNLRVSTAEERKAVLERLQAEKRTQIKQAKEAAEPYIHAPAELGQWGVLKTRCWMTMVRRLRRVLSIQHPRLAELRHLPRLLSDLPGWSADQCAAFLESPETV